MSEIRICAHCARRLELDDGYLARVKELTWVEGERYVSVEVQGFIVVWDQAHDELLAVCRQCSGHLMPHHQDTGDVAIVRPAADPSEKA